jgi:hypothetical protein
MVRCDYECIQRSGGPGRSTWLNMGCNQWPAQSHCNNQGFNIHTANHKIRFGMSMNQENQCSSPDTAVGIGIQPGNIAAGAYYGVVSILVMPNIIERMLRFMCGLVYRNTQITSGVNKTTLQMDTQMLTW